MIDAKKETNEIITKDDDIYKYIDEIYKDNKLESLFMKATIDNVNLYNISNDYINNAVNKLITRMEMDRVNMNKHIKNDNKVVSNTNTIIPALLSKTSKSLHTYYDSRYIYNNMIDINKLPFDTGNILFTKKDKAELLNIFLAINEAKNKLLNDIQEKVNYTFNQLYIKKSPADDFEDIYNKLVNTRLIEITKHRKLIFDKDELYNVYQVNQNKGIFNKIGVFINSVLCNTDDLNTFINNIASIAKDKFDSSTMINVIKYIKSYNYTHDELYHELHKIDFFKDRTDEEKLIINRYIISFIKSIFTYRPIFDYCLLKFVDEVISSHDNKELLYSQLYTLLRLYQNVFIQSNKTEGICALISTKIIKNVLERNIYVNMDKNRLTEEVNKDPTKIDFDLADMGFKNKDITKFYEENIKIKDNKTYAEKYTEMLKKILFFNTDGSSINTINILGKEITYDTNDIIVSYAKRYMMKYKNNLLDNILYKTNSYSWLINNNNKILSIKEIITLFINMNINFMEIDGVLNREEYDDFFSCVRFISNKSTTELFKYSDKFVNDILAILKEKNLIDNDYVVIPSGADPTSLNQIPIDWINDITNRLPFFFYNKSLIGVMLVQYAITKMFEYMNSKNKDIDINRFNEIITNIISIYTSKVSTIGAVAMSLYRQHNISKFINEVEQAINNAENIKCYIEEVKEMINDMNKTINSTNKYNEEDKKHFILFVNTYNDFMIKREYLYYLKNSNRTFNEIIDYNTKTNNTRRELEALEKKLTAPDEDHTMKYINDFEEIWNIIYDEGILNNKQDSEAVYNSLSENEQNDINLFINMFRNIDKDTDIILTQKEGTELEDFFYNDIETTIKNIDTFNIFTAYRLVEVVNDVDQKIGFKNEIEYSYDEMGFKIDNSFTNITAIIKIAYIIELLMIGGLNGKLFNYLSNHKNEVVPLSIETPVREVHFNHSLTSICEYVEDYNNLVLSDISRIHGPDELRNKEITSIDKSKHIKTLLYRIFDPNTALHTTYTKYLPFVFYYTIPTPEDYMTDKNKSLSLELLHSIKHMAGGEDDKVNNILLSIIKILSLILIAILVIIIVVKFISKFNERTITNKQINKPCSCRY